MQFLWHQIGEGRLWVQAIQGPKQSLECKADEILDSNTHDIYIYF